MKAWNTISHERALVSNQPYLLERVNILLFVSLDHHLIGFLRIHGLDIGTEDDAVGGALGRVVTLLATGPAGGRRLLWTLGSAVALLVTDTTGAREWTLNALIWAIGLVVSERCQWSVGTVCGAGRYDVCRLVFSEALWAVGLLVVWRVVEEGLTRPGHS